MGFFNKISKEEARKYTEYACSLSWDDIKTNHAVIVFGPRTITLRDDYGNQKEFEGDIQPSNGGGGVTLFTRAKQDVLNYMKSNRYRFVNKSDEKEFKNYHWETASYDTLKDFPIEKY